MLVNLPTSWYVDFPNLVVGVSCPPPTWCLKTHAGFPDCRNMFSFFPIFFWKVFLYILILHVVLNNKPTNLENSGKILRKFWENYQTRTILSRLPQDWSNTHKKVIVVGVFLSPHFVPQTPAGFWLPQYTRKYENCDWVAYKNWQWGADEIVVYGRQKSQQQPTQNFSRKITQ